MNFLEKIKNSIYGPKYYQEIIEKPFSYSLKYFVVFGLIFALLFTTISAIKIIPEINKFLNKAKPEITKAYPDELEITIKSGTVSTNIEGPSYVPFPDSWELKENKKQATSPKNLITIDTKSEPSIDNLNKYDTLILITKNYAIYQDSREEITTRSLKDIPDMVINEASLIRLYDKYSPYLNFISPIIILFVFIFSFFFLAFKLVYLLLATLLIWLIAHVKKVEIKYGKAYQLGIHLMTLPLLVVSLTPISFPFAFTTLLLILAAINIQKKPIEEVIPKIIQS